MGLAACKSPIGSGLHEAGHSSINKGPRTFYLDFPMFIIYMHVIDIVGQSK